MSVIHMDTEFDDSGLARFIYEYQGFPINIFVDFFSLSNTTNFRADWKDLLNNVVRGQFIPEADFRYQHILFRYSNNEERPNYNEPGIIAINKCKREILLDGTPVIDAIYDDLLPWFHRMLKLAFIDE